tara:strand:+ start:639 stop:1046 length:408 start_codon:yes stop_codon:yes gene_type:complete
MRKSTLGKVGTGRVYFSRDGVELVDHPANGMSIGGLGASVATFGKLRCHRCVFVAGRDHTGVRTFVLNEEDFGGPVMVKTWFPAKEYNEVFALCDPVTAAAKGGVLTGHDDSHIGRDGRGVDFQGHEPFSEYVGE